MLEMSFPTFKDQRFWTFSLNELFDSDSVIIRQYIKDICSRRALCDKVIRDIQYPFDRYGNPTDVHIWNAFQGKKCYEIKLDFWQKGSETVAQLMGDCEDSSILIVTCARAMNVPPNEIYETFGYVREADSQRLLGGHGWAVFVLYDDKQFRLVESTLDQPPVLYPIVRDIKKPFRINNIEYVPEWIFNWKEFEMVNEINPPKRKKETREKYLAIHQAWKIPTKFEVAESRLRLLRARRLIGRILRKQPRR